jgi:stringent starvation protein B
MAKNSRKILVPLATLLAAGAVAVGSGATFTSTTASTTAVESGRVEHTNDVTSLDIENIKPGDRITGTVTLTNTGTLPATTTLRETSSTNDFEAGALNLVLTNQAGVQLYSGEFGGLADAQIVPVGAMAVGEKVSVTWTVTLAQTATNTSEGKAAGASYQWVSTQNAGVDLPFVSAITLPNLGD